MRDYSVHLGVPSSAIVLDFAGRRTYDTCYRARAIFEVQDVILVTQQYHLSRAIYTCNALGLQVVGVSAERAGTSYAIYGQMREIPAHWLHCGRFTYRTLSPFWVKPEPIFSVMANSYGRNIDTPTGYPLAEGQYVRDAIAPVPLSRNSTLR